MQVHGDMERVRGRATRSKVVMLSKQASTGLNSALESTARRTLSVCVKYALMMRESCLSEETNARREPARPSTEQGCPSGSTRFIIGRAVAVEERIEGLEGTACSEWTVASGGGGLVVTDTKVDRYTMLKTLTTLKREAAFDLGNSAGAPTHVDLDRFGTMAQTVHCGVCRNPDRTSNGCTMEQMSGRNVPLLCACILACVLPAIGCNDDVPKGLSGLPANTRLVDLAEVQRAQLCDWSVEKLGGYGDKCDAGGTFRFMSYPDQAACLKALSNPQATCEATVGQEERCVNAIKVCATQADLKGLPECEPITKC